MRVDDDSVHEEHVKVLEALSSNLKSEVSRGLKLLDSCVSQIAQAKWILTSVEDSLSGFGKGCPACGILSEKEKEIIRLPAKSFSPKRNSEMTKNKPISPKVSKTQPIPRASRSPSPVPKVVSSKLIHKVGPRSKTRPNEVVGTAAGTPNPSVSRPIAPVSVRESSLIKLPTDLNVVKLPKTLNIVISQTRVQIPLLDVRPYLHGRSAKVDLRSLNGYISAKHVIPKDLQFKPKVTSKTVKAKPKHSTPGAASRRFLETLQKQSSLQKGKPKSTSSNTSNAVIHNTCTVDNNSSTKIPPQPPPGPTKKKSSDSGSDYDYNFAKSAPVPSATVKKKSKIGTQPKLKKRPRHHSSSDSDADYVIKKKATKSIFKKKTATTSDSGSESDEYQRRKKKKKKKRKYSTDKEKDLNSSKNASKASSVLSSTRMTITLDPAKSKPITSVVKIEEQEPQKKALSAIKCGSTTSSLVKSESGTESTSKPISKPAETASAKPYKPGPASKKLKAAEPLPPSQNSDVVSDTKCKEVTSTEDKNKKPTNDSKVEASVAKPDPFALLKEKLFNEKRQAEVGAVEGTAGDKPKKAEVSAVLKTGLLNRIKQDPKTKAALISKLSLMSAQKNKVPVPKQSQAESKTTNSTKKVSPEQSSLKKSDDEKSDAEEKQIELGDDVIGKCIGGIAAGDEAEATASPAPIPFVLSPMPPPTLQDCVSPTAMDKFFTAPAPEPDSALSATVEKINSLLLKLATEKRGNQDAVLLRSQEKMNEIFDNALTPTSLEMETFNSDLEDGLWYLVKDKTLGKAACSDTVSVVEWDKISRDELEKILAALESFL